MYLKASNKGSDDIPDPKHSLCLLSNVLQIDGG